MTKKFTVQRPSHGFGWFVLLGPNPHSGLWLGSLPTVLGTAAFVAFSGETVSGG